MRLRIIAPSLSALALAACSGSVTVTGTGGGGGETTTSTSHTNTTGTATTSTGTGSCTRTTDNFSFTFKKDTESLDCAGAKPGGGSVTHVDGEVIASTPTSFKINTCPPNADCFGPFATFEVSSPGFTLDLPVGTYVQIDVRIDFPWGCSQTILVRNLPTWGGLASPGGPSPILYFAGSDGAVSPLDGTPFSVTNTALGCDGTNQGCGIADDHRFEVSGKGSPVQVYQGQTSNVPITDAGLSRLLSFRNLRSFETGWCDDYWNWAWWAKASEFPPD